jgi:hypothetical protein
VYEQAFAGPGEARTLLGDELRVANVKVAIDEVADDFDLACDAEVFAGALAQVGGDGGDAVRLVDAEARNGEIGAVEADESDVGAVEGGDEGRWRPFLASIWRASSALTLWGIA